MLKRVLWILLLILLTGCEKPVEIQPSISAKPSITPMPTISDKTPYDFPKGDIIFKDIIPNTVVALTLQQSDIGSHVFVTLNKQAAKQFLELIQNHKMSTDYEIVHGTGGYSIIMTITNDENEQYFYKEVTVECTIEMKVNDDSILYGYPTSQNPIIESAMNQYFDGVLVTFKTDSGVFSLVPLLIENENYTITGEYYDGWLPPYNSIKDYDFISDGFTAYENGQEIECFPKEVGEHYIILQNEIGKYQLKYFVQ